MLYSKEVLEKSGISRATLNNYVALGILPRPILKKGPKSAGRAPRLGCFPDSTLDTIARVNALKKEGLTMDQIAETIRGERKDVEAKAEALVQDIPLAASASRSASSGSTLPFPTSSRERRRPMVATGAPLHLTVEHMEHPAYLVNNNFDVEWCNEAAS
ncbi:MAG: MerR family transcriptional regulator [Alphaproteobacteria bacterium]|nr:MerR family transcriptional regulator [Alphaproteobacteria bacterium]